MQEIIENSRHLDYTMSVLPPGSLRRLARLGAMAEGAAEAAQAALEVHRHQQMAYRQAFEEACENAGVTVPQGEHTVDINWQSGEVRFTPK